jgi:hypothetical protein
MGDIPGHLPPLRFLEIDQSDFVVAADIAHIDDDPSLKQVRLAWAKPRSRASWHQPGQPLQPAQEPAQR